MIRTRKRNSRKACSLRSCNLVILPHLLRSRPLTFRFPTFKPSQTVLWTRCAMLLLLLVIFQLLAVGQLLPIRLRLQNHTRSMRLRIDYKSVSTCGISLGVPVLPPRKPIGPHVPYLPSSCNSQCLPPTKPFEYLDNNEGTSLIDGSNSNNSISLKM